VLIVYKDYVEVVNRLHNNNDTMGPENDWEDNEDEEDKLAQPTQQAPQITKGAKQEKSRKLQQARGKRDCQMLWT